MTTILVIDDDEGTRTTFALAFVRAGYHVLVATNGRDGSILGRSAKPELVFVDLNLPDMRGTDVLKSIRSASPDTTVVITTGCASTRAVVNAMQLGALNCFDKPVDIDEILEFTQAHFALRKKRAVAPSELQPSLHACERWATAMLCAVESRDDPHTVSRWARAAAASVGALRSWCRTAGLGVKPSLNLARMIRVARHSENSARVADILHFADVRSLNNFLRLGVPLGPPCQLPISIGQLLWQQRWICDIVALDVLRSALGIECPNSNWQFEVVESSISQRAQAGTSYGSDYKN